MSISVYFNNKRATNVGELREMLNMPLLGGGFSDATRLCHCDMEESVLAMKYNVQWSESGDAFLSAKQQPVVPDSEWSHTNGNHYKVLFLTNECTETEHPEKYSTTVVYVGENGYKRSIPLSDWHRSMTPTDSPTIATDYTDAVLVENACVQVVCTKKELLKAGSVLSHVACRDHIVHDLLKYGSPHAIKELSGTQLVLDKNVNSSELPRRHINFAEVVLQPLLALLALVVILGEIITALREFL